MAVGKAVQRVDGVAKVTGKARYTDDFSMPGMRVAKYLRSSIAHGRVVASIPARPGGCREWTGFSPTKTSLKNIRYGRASLIMTSTAFVEKYKGREKVSRTEIRRAHAGNLCRCTGYEGIIRAVEQCLTVEEDKDSDVNLVCETKQARGGTMKIPVTCP